jgi:hypothetical protein
MVTRTIQEKSWKVDRRQRRLHHPLHAQTFECAAVTGQAMGDGRVARRRRFDDNAVTIGFPSNIPLDNSLPRQEN